MENLNTSVFFALNQYAGQSNLGDFLIVFFADYVAYILIAALTLGIFLSEKPRIEKIRVALVSALSGIIGYGFFVESIGNFYRVPRPFVTFPETHRLLFESSYSFPSGHATVFFGLSSIVYSYDKKIGIMFFVLSGIMVIARVMAGVHYPIDILCGAIIGIAIGYISTVVIKNYPPKLVSKYNV